MRCSTSSIREEAKVKNVTTRLPVRRVVSIEVAGPEPDAVLDIRHATGEERVVIRQGYGPEDERMQIDILAPQLTYVIDALMQMLEEIGQFSKPLAASRKRTDVQGAILAQLRAGVIPADPDQAAKALCELTGLARDQIISSLGRMWKSGRVVAVGNTLHDAEESAGA
jgi:hypothetical protein